MPPLTFEETKVNRREFFQQLFGEDPHGVLNIRGIFYKGAALNKFATSWDEADEYIKYFEDEGREVYFGIGALKGANAGAANVLYLKAFYIDIDCGEGKPYTTKKEGLAALTSFMNSTGLPMPTLVDSGNGVHCYWFLDREIHYDLWKPVGMSLKAKTHELEFHVDHSVTGDGAQILRVPDTCNTKDKAKHKPVRVRHVGGIITFEEFAELIPPAPTHSRPQAYKDELTRNLAGVNQVSCSFDLILKKSFKVKEFTTRSKVVITDKDGNESFEYRNKVIEACAGCPQIKYAYEHRTTIDHELWYPALTVAAFCTDREEAIHTISEGHPTYDYHETIKKADSFNGPITCDEYRAKNPDPCNVCGYRLEHKKEGEYRIKSPIMLGKYTEFAQPSDNIIEDVIHDGFAEPVTMEAPMSYPSPWARPKQGGIVRRDFDVEQAEDLDEPAETFIYENDLWVKQILIDPDAGEVLHLVHIQPDGPGKKHVLEFIIPSEDATRREALQRRLAFYGVHAAFTPATANLLQQYIKDWVSKLKKEQPKFFARSHYGWHEEAFVVGKREFTPNQAMVYSPASKATEDTAEYLMPKGNLELWRQMANLYGTPGNEARAFIFFVSFGAPLCTFLNQGSCIIHLTNKDSGVGKSTNQRVSASTWGDPKELMLLSTDTDNAKYQQFGVFRNLPIYIDEITNMPPDRLSDFAFRVSQNRGKHRQNSHSNTLRKNTTKWETIIVTSGNNSLYDTLKQHKINVAGELNRIIELPVSVKDALSIEEASYWYEQVLFDNFGLAGEIYAQYLVDNKAQVVAMVKATYELYAKKFNFKTEHRFYRAACAATFTGARIAKELGLHDIDVDRVEQWAVQQLGGIQTTVKEAGTQDSVATLGQFLNAYKRNELVLNAGKVMAGGLELSQAPTKDAQGQLVIRVEQDTSRMYISKSVLMHWCGEHRVHFTVLIDDLDAAGLLVSKALHKRLAEGTSSPGLPVACICVDMARANKMRDELALDAPVGLQ